MVATQFALFPCFDCQKMTKSFFCPRLYPLHPHPNFSQSACQLFFEKIPADICSLWQTNSITAIDVCVNRSKEQGSLLVHNTKLRLTAAFFLRIRDSTSDSSGLSYDCEWLLILGLCQPLLFYSAAITHCCIWLAFALSHSLFPASFTPFTTADSEALNSRLIVIMKSNVSIGKGTS